jgi:5-formyltetrahydrofolate cyclo-ligase
MTASNDIPAPNDRASIKAWRRGERARLIERRTATSVDEREVWSAAITARLHELAEEIGAHRIGFYWAFKAEFSALPFITEMLRQGREATLPVIVEKNAPMEFRRWTPETEMATGSWDIPIPKERRIVVPDLILAPLVGFDAENYRLGYGGGYFDRTLAALSPRPFTIGIGFELARLPTTHPQEHDIPMDVVVTEAGVQRRREGAGAETYP